MPPPAGLRLEPLLSTCRRRGARRLTLFGSAVVRPLAAVADVDLHLVVPRMDRALYDELAAAAGETARRLAAPAGRPWSVELRHGPFKPGPVDPLPLQLHLVADDETSLALASGTLRAQRAATGRLLLGDDAPPAAGERPPAGLREEARAELARWREALAARRVPFRHWRFDPAPHLAAGWAPATTAWELRCLVRGAAVAADLHFFAAVRWGPPLPEEAVELARPLLFGLAGELAEWRELPARADRVVERLVAVIDRRLEHLARRRRGTAAPGTVDGRGRGPASS